MLFSGNPGVTVVDGQPNIRGGSGWSYGAGCKSIIINGRFTYVTA